MIHAATEMWRERQRMRPRDVFLFCAGTEHVLEFAATHETRRFLLTSSGDSIRKAAD